MTALPHAGCGERGTDLLPAIKSSSPEPIFYDDEDTALLLHCKFNKLHSSGLLAWRKGALEPPELERVKEHRKKLDYQFTASHGRLFRSNCGRRWLPCQ